MNVLFNSERLRQMLGSLYLFSGIHTNIYDKSGRDIRIFGSPSEFCQLMNQIPEGSRRCEHCDAMAVVTCMEKKRFHTYRCHAGLCETILPIFSQGELVAFLAFGQVLDDQPYETQWERTLGSLSWYGGDREPLREAFFHLKRVPPEKQQAYEQILEAVALYISLEGIIMSTELSEQQRLEIYINDHFREKLSLDQIARDLNMGTTKLCALAKKLTGEGSVTKMISARRIAEAKALLANENLSITQIAEQVGFSDYSYFTNVFRKTTSLTPTAYRKSLEQDMTSLDRPLRK